MKSICDPPSPGPSHLTGDVTEPPGLIGITFARCASATVLCLALGIVSIADALAGGAGLYEIATPDLGLAAAGYAARAQDASTLLTNPAGMTRLQRSELLVGAQVLYGDIKFSPNSQTSSFLGHDNGGNPIDVFPGGSQFYVHSLSPDLKVGVGLFGNFGAVLKYDGEWVGRYLVRETTLLGLSFMPAVAYRVAPQLSLGLGLNVMYGVFSNKTAINNLLPSLGDGELKLKDTDWGFGANAGVLYEPTAGTRFGVTYNSEIKLDFKDTPRFSNTGPALTNLTQRFTQPIQIGITVPQGVMASVYHELSGTWAILGNVGWQDWSRFGKVGIEIDDPNQSSLTVNRRYKDSWHAALGAQHRISDTWLLSAGVAYDSSIVEDADRTVDVPLGATWRFGIGGQNQLSDGVTLSLGYELAWSGDLPIDQQRGPLSGRVAGTYENTALHFFGVTMSWKY